jgi:hypothetical protein
MNKIAIALAAITLMVGAGTASAWHEFNYEWYEEENDHYIVNWLGGHWQHADAHVYKWCLNVPDPEEFYQTDPDQWDMVSDAFGTWGEYIDTLSGLDILFTGAECEEYVNPDQSPPFLGCDDATMDDGINRVTVQDFTGSGSMGTGTAGKACPMDVDQTTSATQSGRVFDCDLNLQRNEFLDQEANTTGRFYPFDNLYEVALHEIGHCLGLAHPVTCNQGEISTVALMCPANQDGSSDQIEQDDLDGVFWIYGDGDGDGCTGAEESWLNVSQYHNNFQNSDSNSEDFMDVNHNGVVNSQDLAMESASPFPDAAPFDSPRKDFPTNGVINSADMGRMAEQFNWKCMKP